MGHGAPLILHHGSAITGRERDLILGYEMDAQERAIINKEVTGLGGGSDGQVTGCTQVRDPVHGNGLRFRHNNWDVLYVPTITGNTKDEGAFKFTVRPWALEAATTYRITFQIAGGTRYYIWFGVQDLITRFGNAAVQDSGVDGIVGKSMRVIVTWESNMIYVFVDGHLVDSYAATMADDLTDLLIGADTLGGGNSLDGELFQYMFLRHMVTDEEAKRDYLRYATRPWYQESFRSAHVSTAGTLSGVLENTRWWVDSINGTDIRIAHDLLAERTFGIKGAKYIECLGAGRVWIPTQRLGMRGMDPEAAYGTWDFWMRKDGGSSTYVYFISSTNNPGTTSGYLIFLNPSERIYIQTITGGVVGATNMRTVANIVTADEWFHLRLARRATDGRFTVFLNGEQIQAADIDIGTNPFTDNTHQDSSYLLADPDPGDALGPMSQRWGEIT